MASRGVEEKLWAPKCGQRVLTAVYQITLERSRIAKCPTIAQRIWPSPIQKAEDTLYRTNISV